MADVSVSNVAAGLIGGAAGSFLTFAGALYLQTRAERRLRRARLMALETELRWNRIIARSLVEENKLMGDLANDCWKDNYVALAADMPGRVYSDLRLHYYTFARAVESYDRVRQPQASDDDREFLVWWSHNAETMQALVTGELHLAYKLRYYISTLVELMGRSLSGRRGKNVGGKGHES